MRIAKQITIAGFSSVGKSLLIRGLLAKDWRIVLGIPLDATVEAFGGEFRPLKQISESQAEYVLFHWESYTDYMVDRLGQHRIILLTRDLHQHLADWHRVKAKRHSWVLKVGLAGLEKYRQGVLRRFVNRPHELWDFNYTLTQRKGPQ